MTSHRSSYWDNAKGILIFLVLIGHFIMTYRPLKAIFDSIYLFHMPAFLFISGLFSKKKLSNFQKNTAINTNIISV